MPEGLSPEQKKIFRESLTFIRHPGTGYQTTIAELLAKHPDLAKKMEVIRRDQVIDRVAAVFSKSKNIMELPIEVVETLASLCLDDLKTSIEVAVLLDRAKLRLTKEELQKALDIGRVIIHTSPFRDVRMNKSVILINIYGLCPKCELLTERHMKANNRFQVVDEDGRQLIGKYSSFWDKIKLFLRGQKNEFRS